MDARAKAIKDIKDLTDEYEKFDVSKHTAANWIIKQNRLFDEIIKVIERFY